MNDTKSMPQSEVALSFLRQQIREYNLKREKLTYGITQTVYDTIVVILTDPMSYTEEFDPAYLQSCFHAVTKIFLSAFNFKQVQGHVDMHFVGELVKVFYGPKNSLDALFNYQPYDCIKESTWEHISNILEYSIKENNDRHESEDRSFAIGNIKRELSFQS